MISKSLIYIAKKKEMRRKKDVHFSAVQYFMETQMDYFNFQLCDRLELEQWTRGAR